MRGAAIRRCGAGVRSVGRETSPLPNTTHRSSRRTARAGRAPSGRRPDHPHVGVSIRRPCSLDRFSFGIRTASPLTHPRPVRLDLNPPLPTPRSTAAGRGRATCGKVHLVIAVRFRRATARAFRAARAALGMPPSTRRTSPGNGRDAFEAQASSKRNAHVRPALT